MSILREIEEILELHQNPATATAMEDYMRGKFPFLGIKAPLRRTLIKDIVKEFSKEDAKSIIEIVDELWQLPEREYQMVGLDILSRSKKKFSSEDIGHLEYWITTKSWWDTVDLIASHNVGHLFYNDHNLRDRYTKMWLKSENIWLNRTCLIYQLKYKKDTDLNLLFFNIEALRHKNEFFIQKAIGWAMRQASKFYADEIHDFISNTQLSSLARKEGSKYLN